MDMTMVQLRKSTVEKLKKQKRYPRQTYDEVVNELIDDDVEILTPEELKEIEQGLADIKAGHGKSLEQVAKELGINAALENKNDIIVNGKKISGNASKLMDKGIYLQHGTLAYDIDNRLMPSALNITKDSVMEKATSILQHKKIHHQKIYNTLKNNFINNKDFRTEELSKYELMRAEDLAKTNYSVITLPTGYSLKNKGACYVERG